MKPYIAEFVGTALLVLLGNGVVAGVLLKRSKAEQAGWIVITVGWGLAVAMAVYAVGPTSGAHLNPAVSISLATIDSFPWDEVPGYIAAQMLGAFAGAVLVYLHYRPHWRATDDADAKLAAFSTGPAIPTRPWNLLAEAVGTFVLVFGILAIAANADAIDRAGEAVDLPQLFSVGLAPALVGLLVLAIGVSLGGPTGYAINPARDLGPRLAHAVLPIAGKGASNFAYAWIPVLGPVVGGVLGAVVWDALDFGA